MNRQRLRPTTWVWNSMIVSWCSGVTVPAGPNQNDARSDSSARSQIFGSVPMSASKRRKLGAAQHLVVGRHVVVVGGATGKHLVDKVGQPDAGAGGELVLLVLRVRGALGLDLHIDVAEAGFQVLWRPALHCGPVGGHVGQHQRAAAANVALHEFALRDVLALSTRV